MRRLILHALLLLAAGPAAAQVYAVPTPFCGGALVAERFETRVTPGPQGRVDYMMQLRNTGRDALRFRVQMVGDVLGRPTGEQAIPAAGASTIMLGYQPNTPGRMPLRNEQLANAVRVSCLAG